MAAPHSTSLRALRAIAQPQKLQVAGNARGLHVTGSHSAPASRSATKSAAPTSFHGRSLADLRNECRSRMISPNGTAADLAERLNQHDALQQRAYSIAIRRIGSETKRSQPKAYTARSERPFNTSRSAQAPNDASPIDFAFIPSAARLPMTDHSQPRVPILPDSYRTSTEIPASDAPVMKAEIYTVSDPENVDGTGPSPMSEVTDNHAVEMDQFGIAEAVEKAKAGARRVGEVVERDKGVMRGMWEGFVEDVMGNRRSVA